MAGKGGDRVPGGGRGRGVLHLPAHGPPDPTVLDRPSRLFDTAGPGDTIRVAMFRWDIQPPTDRGHSRPSATACAAVVYLVGDDDLRLNKHVAAG